MDSKALTTLILGVANRVRYTNYKGDTRIRFIVPYRIWFGTTEYHPEPQWLVCAVDMEKNEQRDFALRDMVPLKYNEAQ